MLLTICLTFIVTTLFYLFVACLACWRVTRHLRENAAAVGCVLEHVLMPLFSSPRVETVELVPQTSPKGEVAAQS